MKIQWNLGPINSKHDKSVLKKRNCGSRREGKKLKREKKELENCKEKKKGKY
jgi:hypothetical protein